LTMKLSLRAQMWMRVDSKMSFGPISDLNRLSWKRKVLWDGCSVVRLGNDFYYAWKGRLRIVLDIKDLLRKSDEGGSFSKPELEQMLSYSGESLEAYQIMAEASRLSRELTQNKAEVHAQLALNLAPCAGNCSFCSFARINGVFQEETRVSPEQAVHYARQFETDGANAVYIMTTAHYPFELFIEMSQEIRSHLRPETMMIANVGDQSLDHAKKIKETGYSGVYHALRLREGRDTSLSPRARRDSIRNFQEAGLRVGTCVEPVGPEHTNEELADAILFTASFGPSFSGAARRIAIPGTQMASRGMISELRMCQIVAVTKLAMPRTVLGNCTHEPCSLGPIAGANLFWAEVGANPRDVEKKTEEGRGETVEGCKYIFHESGWEIWDGRSRYYGREKVCHIPGRPD
jgi:biotin synthase